MRNEKFGSFEIIVRRIAKSSSSLGTQASCLHLGPQASSLQGAGRMPAVPGTWIIVGPLVLFAKEVYHPTRGCFVWKDEVKITIFPAFRIFTKDPRNSL